MTEISGVPPKVVTSASNDRLIKRFLMPLPFSFLYGKSTITSLVNLLAIYAT